MGREGDGPLDILIDDGKIAAIGKALQTIGEELDLAGKLATPGMVETHIHLDKACILDRCAPEPKTGPTNHAARVVEANAVSRLRMSMSAPAAPWRNAS